MDAKKQKLDQAFQTHRPAMQALVQRRKDTLTQLNGLVKANVADAKQVNLLIKQLQKTQDDLLRSRNAFWDDISKFLTVFQYAKFVVTDVTRSPEATDEVW